MLSYIVFAHFIADWAFQDHYTAMNKANKPIVRLFHTITYGAVLECLVRLPSALAGLTFLFALVMHYVIDSYIPVYWWMKYIQNDPNAQTKELFKEGFKQPRFLLMAVMLDQLLHILTLLPLAHILENKL